MTSHISIDSKLIEYDVIEIQSRSMSDPPLSDIDWKIKCLGPDLPLEVQGAIVLRISKILWSGPNFPVRIRSIFGT